MNDELQALRTQIVNEMVPFATQSDLPVEQKFNLVLVAARLSGDAEKFTIAHDLAQQIEAHSAKASAMLDLLQAIDAIAPQS
jgi:ureidoglycolate hydrolase